MRSCRSRCSRDRSCSCTQSITSAHSQQSGSVGSTAGHHSVHSHATEGGQESSSESELSHDEEDPMMKIRMPWQTRVKLRLQAMARWHPMVKRGKNALKLKTPSPALVKSSVHMRTPTQSLTSRRRSSPSGGSSGNQAPRRTVLPRNPARHLLRKSCPQTRHSTMRTGRKLSSWTHIFMLGATKRLLIYDLPEHRKVQPNHPDPVGLPLDYMGECQVFDGIQSDIYDLCWLYTLGMTGDPPEFPMPWEPATHGQIRDLLKSTHAIG